MSSIWKWVLRPILAAVFGAGAVAAAEESPPAGLAAGVISLVLAIGFIVELLANLKQLFE